MYSLYFLLLVLLLLGFSWWRSSAQVQADQCSNLTDIEKKVEDYEKNVKGHLKIMGFEL